MNWIIAAVAVVNAVLLPLVILVWFPRWLRDVAEAKLWTLRDKLWDASHKDEREIVGADALIMVIERSIKYSGTLAVTRFIPLYAALRTGMPQTYGVVIEAARLQTKAVASSGTDPIVESARHNFASIMLSHTTVGWALTARNAWQKLIRKTSPNSNLSDRGFFSFFTITEAAACADVGNYGGTTSKLYFGSLTSR